jgi:hypothetical protein
VVLLLNGVANVDKFAVFEYEKVVLLGQLRKPLCSLFAKSERMSIWVFITAMCGPSPIFFGKKIKLAHVLSWMFFFWGGVEHTIRESKKLLRSRDIGRHSHVGLFRFSNLEQFANEVIGMVLCARTIRLL